MVDTVSIALCESIAKLYSHVLVVDSWFSVAWLKNHLNSMAMIEWNAIDLPVTIDNVDDWADLRITQLSLSIKNDTPPTWKKALPRFTHLKSLFIEGPSEDLADVYEIVAKSAQITEFQIKPTDRRVDNAELIHLIEWVRRQPVRVFDGWYMNWRDFDRDLKQELCEAMFNCPTMDRLALTEFYLDDLDFTKFSFSMNTLQIHGDFCDYDDELFDYFEEDSNPGLECLLDALPLTPIKSFSFSGFYGSDEAWCWLIPLIFPPNCRLEKLSVNLSYGQTDPIIVEALAKLIQSNHTLSELNLLKCKISISDVRLLIQSISDPSRRVQTKRLKWITRKSCTEDESTLKSLEEFAIECGCEFVQEEGTETGY
ncbi:hypothetical protein AeNC1_013495 [Aphanomyces euteiches]|nr:hypothetical protein AeNC1_013495 [Aphanomyces euteiches]